MTLESLAGRVALSGEDGQLCRDQSLPRLWWGGRGRALRAHPRIDHLDLTSHFTDVVNEVQRGIVTYLEPHY